MFIDGENILTCECEAQHFVVSPTTLNGRPGLHLQCSGCEEHMDFTPDGFNELVGQQVEHNEGE